MKKIKFNIGDKVFAKVKGYPAWPAQVVGVNGKKYQVRFYGTGETGTIKLEDLFYYSKHKEQFIKSLKRKDYNDAIEEIEKAISEDGTDGSDENKNDSFTANENSFASNTSTNDSSNDIKRNNKRKRTSSDENASAKKIIKKQNISEVNQVKENHVLSSEDPSNKHNNENTETNRRQSAEVYNAKKESTDVENKAQDSNETFKDNNEENIDHKRNGKKTKKDNKEEKMAVKFDKRSPKKGKIKYKIVSDEYLKALVAYAEHVRKEPEKYKNKPPEDRPRSKNEIVLAKVPNGQYIGIKYNRDLPPAFKSEYEHAEYDETEANTILSLKKLIEDGSCKSEDDPNLFETNLNLSEEEIQETIELQILEHKTSKLNFLKREQELVELDGKIKSCLGLDKAEPKQALMHLEKILELDIDPLMLLKHPHVVDMVKRLRRYVGNTKEWNLSETNLASFQADAAEIREKACELFDKFLNMLDINESEDKNFFDQLSQKMDEFKQSTSQMTTNEVFALCAQPDSRQAFLDKLEDEEENKLINSKMEKHNKAESSEKENSNQLAENNLPNETQNCVENNIADSTS